MAEKDYIGSGTYKGGFKTLFGKRAMLLDFGPYKVLAQFDDLTLKESHGWYEFFRYEFEMEDRGDPCRFCFAVFGCNGECSGDGMMGGLILKKYIDRLRESSGLPSDDVSDDALIKAYENTLSGACIKLGIATDNLVQAVREELSKMFSKKKGGGGIEY